MQKNYLTNQVALKLSFGISLALYLFFILSIYLHNFILPPNEANLPAIILFIISFFSWATTFLLIYFLFIINFKLFKTNFSQKKKIVIITLASFVLAVVFNILMIYIQDIINSLFPNSIPVPPFKWAGIVRDLVLAVIVIFISQILYLTQKKQQTELEYEAVKAENARSRFETLKNQLDPHFLFNTLSILDSLVDEDTQKTHEFIQKLSSSYRYILQSKEIVSLKEELNFIDGFFSLMQVRFDENLIIKKDIDSKFIHYHIVPLGLQTLVENAITHNIISKQNPLIITISTTDNGELTVSNNYQPKEMPTGRHRHRTCQFI